MLNTIHDSSAYYKLRQRVITIYDGPVITIFDNYYYNLRQVLQFPTLLQFTTENMMLAVLPIACVQIPLPSVKIGEGPLLRFLLRVCTQAALLIHFLISGQLLRTPDNSNFSISLKGSTNQESTVFLYLLN